MSVKAPVVLPPNRQWSQPNTGYLFGSIYQSQNITLEIPGVISLSKRMQYLGREDSSGSSFDHLLNVVFDGRALAGSTARYYLISSDKIYRLSQALGTFVIDPTAGTPGLSIGSSDGVIWNDGLYVTTSSNMSKLVADVWTGSLMSLTASIPHPLCVSTINNYLLVGNGNVLKKRTTAGTNSDALTIPDNYRIQWIRSDNARVLIGCRNLNGGNGAIFEWDETAAAATNKYDIDANWPLSGEFRNTDFFVMANDGRLLKFNGGGFSEAARLPIYKSLQGSWVNGFSLGTVFQRGMHVVEGRLNILVNTEVDNSSEYYPNFPSGVWEYDEATGLNHKYGLSNSNTGTDYAQLALGGGAGALGSIYIDPVSGAPDSTTGGVLLSGGMLRGAASGTSYFTVGSVISNGTNRGSFVTTRIETVDIADASSKLWVKYRGLFTSEDKLVFKYKDRIRSGLPFCTDTTVTWSSTTVFTSTDTGWTDSQVGDEVTNLSGSGSGAAAHISSIVNNAGTYTITLDEAIPNIANTDTTYVICDNFKKLEVSITSTDTNGYKDIPIPQDNPATWIQVKTELRGSYLVTVEELQLITEEHVTPEP